MFASKPTNPFHSLASCFVFVVAASGDQSEVSPNESNGTALSDMSSLHQIFDELMLSSPAPATPTTPADTVSTNGNGNGRKTSGDEEEADDVFEDASEGVSTEEPSPVNEKGDAPVRTSDWQVCNGFRDESADADPLAEEDLTLLPPRTENGLDSGSDTTATSTKETYKNGGYGRVTSVDCIIHSLSSYYILLCIVYSSPIVCMSAM